MPMPPARHTLVLAPPAQIATRRFFRRSRAFHAWLANPATLTCDPGTSEFSISAPPSAFVIHNADRFQVPSQTLRVVLAVLTPQELARLVVSPTRLATSDYWRFASPSGAQATLAAPARDRQAIADFLAAHEISIAMLRCRECKYDTSTIRQPICPECGFNLLQFNANAPN